MKQPYKRPKYKKKRFEASVEVKPFSEEEQELMDDLMLIQFEGMEFEMDVKKDGSMHKYLFDRKTARLLMALDLYRDN